MSTFTPGSWVTGDRLGIEDDKRSVYAGSDPDTALAVGVCYSALGVDPNTEDEYSPSRIVAEANARLIAAAPDMYAALETVWHVLSRSLEPSKEEVAEVAVAAREALAKARSES